MNPLSAWSRRALCVPIRWYQKWISPGLGRNCRFTPSCSQYAIEAIQTHGCIKGLLLAAARIARCNPLGRWGYDPVPEPGRWRNPARKLSPARLFSQDTENKWKTNLSVTPAACRPFPFRHLRATSPGRGRLSEQGRRSRKAIQICFL